MNPTVLICDDNYAVHESLKTFLRLENIDYLSAYSGEDAMRLIEKERIDLVVLDIMLPGVYGDEICRQIREKSNIPIIMLSALGSVSDRIKGLRLGADDYISKPFSPSEVVVRIQTILKRTRNYSSDHVLSFEELRVDPDAFTVTVNGEEIPATPGEVKMLIYLIKNSNIALSRERLLDAVWGYDYVGDTRVVDALINRLRKKLPRENVNFQISSIYGIGFKLEKIR